MSNRFENAKPEPCKSPGSLPPLPIINWSLINHTAPEIIDLGKPFKEDLLPKSDIVIITWTSAEWSALDHVFLNSNNERDPNSTIFQNDWHWRSKKVTKEDEQDLWGYYRMVKIKNAGGVEEKVLLFKSNAHLAHPPYCTGLIEMVRMIIDEAKPNRLYSIGTAGGSSKLEKIGDTVIANSGHVSIQQSQNKSCKINNIDVSCKDWFPSFNLMSRVEDKLLFKLSQVVSVKELEYLLCKTIHDPEKGNPSWEGTVTINDLVNEALDPVNLNSPRALNKKNIPLLTTDYYFIAKGNDSVQYSALEMDDAVIGLVAGECNTNYVFVRNISDPLVPDKTKDGKPIVDELMQSWSGQIYGAFGIYTSMNGALLTWATIAGDTSSLQSK